jgi:hypothetical protein
MGYRAAGGPWNPHMAGAAKRIDVGRTGGGVDPCPSGWLGLVASRDRSLRSDEAALRRRIGPRSANHMETLAEVHNTCQWRTCHA